MKLKRIGQQWSVNGESVLQLLTWLSLSLFEPCWTWWKMENTCRVLLPSVDTIGIYISRIWTLFVVLVVFLSTHNISLLMFYHEYWKDTRNLPQRQQKCRREWKNFVVRKTRYFKSYQGSKRCVCRDQVLRLQQNQGQVLLTPWY